METETTKASSQLTDGFKIILLVQRKLQERMGWPNGTGVEAARNNLLHTHAEVSEVLDEIHWKPHKRHKPEYGQLKSRDRFVMELTDVIQTWANVAIAYDVTPEELAAALTAKWGINFDNIADGVYISKEADHVDDNH